MKKKRKKRRKRTTTEWPTFKVSYDIPPPPPRETRRYPLADMKVGGSFFVETRSATDHRQVYKSVTRAAKKLNVTIRSKSWTDDNGRPGLRFWRIE
jgi:hypothetical protein